MSGEKINWLKKSIRYVMKVLKENDRICIVTFEDASIIKSPWLMNSAKNKPTIKGIIKELRGGGGTNIAEGMNSAFLMMKKRKWKNPITMLFLLSDGQDSGADERTKYLYEQMKFNEENFMIRTFG